MTTQEINERHTEKKAYLIIGTVFGGVLMFFFLGWAYGSRLNRICDNVGLIEQTIQELDKPTWQAQQQTLADKDTDKYLELERQTIRHQLSKHLTKISKDCPSPGY